MVQTGKKGRSSLCGRLCCQNPWGIVFELHQLNVPWDDMQSREIGLLDDIPQWTLLGVVSERSVKRFIRTNVKLWLESKEGRQTRLRIQVNRQYSVAS